MRERAVLRAAAASMSGPERPRPGCALDKRRKMGNHTAMTPGYGTRTVAAALVALLAISSLGYWALSAYRRSDLQKSVAALVRDSSDRMKAAFAIQTETQQTVTRLDDHAQEVDKHLIELRGLRASPDRPLVDGADEYLLTVRQILRNLAASHRYRVQMAASDKALRDHMRTTARRTAPWIQEALRAKDRLERDYLDYRLSVEAYDRLLESLPETSKRLATHVGAGAVADTTAIADARRRALENLKRAAGEVDRARQLAAVR
jgi:hypothetical protein